jgi:pimeloyl-ACP methyl ester carboxylesterase
MPQLLPYLSLAALLIVAGAISAGAAVAIMAVSLLRPPRMNDGKALWVLRRVCPADLGLGYEDMSFTVRDERTGRRIKMAGWWMPNADAAGRCVVMLHGYADAKVGAIAWAPLWHRLGYNILAIDLRAHGQSEGVYSTAGYFERHDVNQVIDQLLAQRPQQAKRLVLFGMSLGASVAAAVAAMRDDLAGIVMDSPYAHFSHTAMAHMERLGAPGGLLQAASLDVAQRLSCATFETVALPTLLPQIAAPIMAILPKEDAMLTSDDLSSVMNTIHQRGKQRDVVWLVDDANHLEAYQRHPAEYEQRIAEFVQSLCSSDAGNWPGPMAAAAASIAENQP